MRVLHVNRDYVSVKLHRAMVEHFPDSVSIDVFAPIGWGEARGFAPKPNEYVVECYGKLDRPFFRRKQRLIHGAFEGIGADKRYDVLHAHTLFTAGCFTRRLSHEIDAPFVVTVRNTDLNSFMKYRPDLRSLAYRVLEDASAVVFLSPAYKKRVVEGLPDSRLARQVAAKSIVAENGLDSYWLANVADPGGIAAKSDRIARGELRLLTVGKVSKGKNQEGVVRAADMLRSNGYAVAVTVVGAVDDMRVYRRIKDAQGCTVVPACDSRTLMGIYRQHDIMVLPSFHETFGMVYPEALSQGLPVVYSRDEGFDGHLPEGQGGLAVDPRNTKEIASAIEAICANYGKMASGCPGLARKFDWELICPRYADLYRSVR